jgi:hypothetical protein
VSREKKDLILGPGQASRKVKNKTKYYLKRRDNFLDARRLQETVDAVHNVGGVQVVVVHELRIARIIVLNLHKEARACLLKGEERGKR